MQPNEIPALPPHHAPTSLKTLLLIFGVLVVAALGYLVWAQNSDPDATDYSATSVKKPETAAPATTETDETADWKTYTNANFSFSLKYPSDWENFYTGTAFNSSDPDRVFGSSGTASKHKDDNPNAKITYLNSEPVILLTYGFYEDNTPANALKNYFGQTSYDAASITDITATSGDKGKQLIGKDSQGNFVNAVVFSLPTRTPTISGQGKGSLFLIYSYKTTEDKTASSLIDKISKTISITN